MLYGVRGKKLKIVAFNFINWSQVFYIIIKYSPDVKYTFLFILCDNFRESNFSAGFMCLKALLCSNSLRCYVHFDTFTCHAAMCIYLTGMISPMYHQFPSTRVEFHEAMNRKKCTHDWVKLNVTHGEIDWYVHWTIRNASNSNRPHSSVSSSRELKIEKWFESK